MGLAFDSIASSNAKPFWQALADTSGTLDQPLFAFQLTRFSNNTNAGGLELGGTFTIGGTNSSLFQGNIDFQPIPSGAPGYWIQSLTSEHSARIKYLQIILIGIDSIALKVNGQTIDIPSGEDSWSAIDTGTTGVGLPQNILTEIFSNIQGSQQRSNGYYEYRESLEANNSLWIDARYD
jgi:hypothetical protein